MARDLLEDYQGALADYNQGIKLNPNDDFAYFLRGNTHSKLGDYQVALADFNQAIKLNPNNADACIVRGNVLSNLGDNKGAIADYSQAIKLDPNNAEAYRNRGFALSNLGDIQGAIADFNQAINLNPNDAFAYSGRGLASEFLEDYTSAIEDFQKAAQLYKQMGQMDAYQETLNHIQEISGLNQDRELEQSIISPPSRPTPSPQPSPSSTPTTLPSESTLISRVTGVDYTPLRNALAAGKWREADQLTGLLLLKAAKREKEGWVESVDNFPCDDLRTIDQLWVKYSRGRFGFSVQKQIWSNIGSNLGAERVGWSKRGEWLSYNELTFDMSAPKGHLPSHRYTRWDGTPALVWGAMRWSEELFSRSANCNL